MLSALIREELMGEGCRVSVLLQQLRARVGIRTELTMKSLWGAGLALLATALLLLPAAVPAQQPEEPAPPAQQPEEPATPDTWYAQAYGQGERGILLTHYWSKGPRFRAEMVIAGHRVVTIVNGEYYYILDVTQGSGVAIRRPAAVVRADTERGRPFGNEYEILLQDGGERVGSERHGGIECDLYRLTNSTGRRSVCVRQGESRLPIRVETYHRSRGSTDVFSYVNWLGGMPLPDSYFEPDPRLEIEILEYADYSKRSMREPIGPAPVMFGNLLHGERE
jgi:hypothetical protein